MGGQATAQIDAATKLYGLLGHPVGHSLSPMLQNGLAARMGVNAAYLAYDVTAEGLAEALRGAYAMGVGGFNVTVPHKQAVMPYLAGIDEKAALIGAVNTLKWEADGWHGYNTDMPGLVRALSGLGIETAGRCVVILGAGGAANAGVCAAAEMGAADILIVNRTRERAEALKERFASQYPVCRIETAGLDVADLVQRMDALAKDAGNRADQWVALQASSVGMHPDTEAALIEDETFYQRIAYGYDFIFNPARTRFMRLVEAGGGRAACGLSMLCYQGVRSFEHWHGVAVPDDVAYALLWELRACQQTT